MKDRAARNVHEKGFREEGPAEEEGTPSHDSGGGGVLRDHPFPRRPKREVERAVDERLQSQGRVEREGTDDGVRDRHYRGTGSSLSHL